MSAAAVPTHSVDGLNLKAAQTGVLNRLLNLHSRDDSHDALSAAALSDSSSASSWKLLIYDRYCQDILSPLLTVNELRQLGITLHMSLHAQRERVPDIPAVYFIRPTEENLQIVARDVKAGLYDSTYINFSTSIPSQLLEQFAGMILKDTPATNGSTKSGGGVLTSGAAAASRIVKIMDQYCEFISLEDRLFTFNNADSFARLNGASNAVGEAEMFAHVDEMVNSLFGVCVTMGVVPIIRAKVGHAAELVASKLDTRLREHLSSRNNLFASNTSGNASLGFHRPLLILTDRNMDLAAPLLHSWTYQSLLHDLMGLSSNRVTVSVSEQGANGAPAKLKPKTYDLLSSEDTFWKRHAGKVFPKVAEGVTERLQAYQVEFNAVTKKTGSVNPSAAALSTGSDDLASAINALPKLQKRKKVLDMHMNIATALLKEIKAREIDAFFDLEQSILQKQSVDKAAIAGIFGGAGAPPEAQAGKGTVTDRLRFLLIWYLTGGVTEDQLAQYKQLIQTAITQASNPTSDPSSTTSSSTSTTPAHSSTAAADLQRELAAIDYVQQFKFLHRLSSGEESGPSSAAPKPTSSSTSGGMLGNFSKLADSLYGGGVGLLAGVRNLLPSNNHLPLTRLVEQLMLNRDSVESLDATYKYFDPKSSGRGRITKLSGSYKECLVFMLGGGTYNEYQNLQDWQKDHQQTQGITSVVYGCSELVAPDTFVKQLANMHLAAQKGHVPVD